MSDTTTKQPEKKLPPNAGKGREAGTPNKTTKVLKEAILLAAEEVGQDGRGKGGLKGYLKRVALKDVKAFSTLLGKVLPMTVTGPNDGPVALVYADVNSLSDDALADIANGRAPKKTNG